MEWVPLRGGSQKPNVEQSNLPGERGRYLLLLGAPLLEDGPRWVHFSWRGESFAIRDFLRGRMTRQSPGITATDVWRAARKRTPAVGEYYRPVEEVDWWVDTLQKLEV